MIHEVALGAFMALEKEMAYYEANVEAWKKDHVGQYVVVKEESVLGFFGSEDEALSAGASEYGLTSFLVRKVGEPPQLMQAPALAFGLLGAYT